MGKFLDYVNSTKEEEEKKKKKEEQKVETPSQKVGNFAKYVVEDYIGFDTFESDYKNVVNQINSATSGWQTQETMKNTKSSIELMKGRMSALDEYQKKFGTGEGVNMSDSLKSFDELLSQWDDLSADYGKYKSSEDYSKALKEIEAANKRREKQKTDNLLYLEKEISALESAMTEAEKKKNNMYNTKNQKQTVYYRSRGLEPDTENLDNRIKSAEIDYNEYMSSLGFESIDDMKKALSDKKVYYNQAKLLQNAIALEKIQEDAKFEEYVESGLALEKETKGNGWINQVAFMRNNPEQLKEYEEIAEEGGGSANRVFKNQLVYKAAKYMTDVEFNVYNAYLGSGNGESANAYLESIEETLNTRMAQDIVGEQDTTFKKLKFSIEAGLDQFEQGMFNRFDNTSDYIAPTSIQMASGIIRESLGDTGFDVLGNSLGQVVYDIGTTTSNMLPSILTSASLNIVAPGVGTVVGAKLMGMSAGGNAYQEMLNLGYDKSQAKSYAKLVGLSEAGLQYALGGISSLGGSVSGKAISSMVEGIDNAIAKWSIKLGMNALSEGTEEALQEVLTPFFENLVLNYQKNTMADIDWKQVAYSGMLGALSSIGLEGGTSAVEVHQENAYRKGMGAEIRTNENIQDTLDLAGMTPEESETYKLYTQYANKGVTSENIKDVQLGHLAHSMQTEASDVLYSKKSTDEQKISALKTLYKVGKYTTPKSEIEKAKAEAKTQAKLKASEYNIGEVSEITDTGDSFKLTGRKIVDGEVVLETSEGDVALSEATLDENNAMLVAYSENMSEDKGNLFVKNYDSNVELDQYYEDFTNVYEMSAKGYSVNNVLKDSGTLTPSQVRDIHNNAISIAEKEFKQVVETINEKSGGNFFGEGTFNDSVIDYTNQTTDGSKVNWKDLNPRQRQAITFMQGVSKALGVNIILEKEGKKERYNGWYDPGKNAIHIDVHAGIDEAGDVDTIIPTLAHEMTHWMKAKANGLYNKMKDFALDTLDAHTDGEIKRVVEAEMERLDEKHPKEDGSKHTEEEAMDEILARTCEDMLTNSKTLAEYMSKLTESEQKSFKDKVKKMFKDILNWVNELLGQYEGASRSAEAKVLRLYKERFEEMQRLFDEALKSAIETNQAAMEQGTTVEQLVKESQKNAEQIVFGDNTMPSEDRMFALRDSENIGRASILYNNKHHLVDDSTMMEGVEVMNAMANVMIPFLEQEGILPPDIKGKTIFKNGSYGRSGENTTKCVRTLTYEDFKDRVAEELGRPLTVAESLLVSQKIYDIAIDPQCIYCYVASDRKAYDEYIGNYQKQMDTFINRMKNGENADELYIEYLDGRKDTDAQKKRFNNWKKIANSNSPYITQKDIATKRKRDAIISKGGALAEQVRDAQRYAQSASWAKKVEEYRAYKGDILKFSKDLVKTLNEEYGFRMYSFSDYTPAFIVENMQMIIDASARGLKSLAYTKDTDYVKIFGKTGQAINISCFAKYDSATKTYVEDNKQGAKWSEAKALREEYDHVGNVMVCTNDDMVLWALKQDWIDVVIPYHIVKTGTTIANEYDWNNYTSESSDKIGNKNANIYPTEHNNDFATYDRLIDERGITPRFNRFYEMIGDQLTADQYMKLVNEVRLPASELSPVVPVFNLEAAMESFGVREDGSLIEGGFVDKGGYFGGWYREGIDVNQEVSAVAKDIADGKSSLDVDYGMNKKAKEKQAEKYGVKQYADRDSDGNILTSEQIDYFKDSQVRDENGNLKVIYHGTQSDFTVFNPMLQGGKNGIAEGYGIYLTDDKEVANNYGEKIMRGYANITHPATTYKKSISKKDIIKLIKTLAETEAKEYVDNGDYTNLQDALKDTWVSNYVYTYEMSMDEAYRKVADVIRNGNENDMHIIQEVMLGIGVRDYESAYEFYGILKSTLGIDGFITEWTHGETNEKSEIAIAFDSSQFKLTTNTNPTKNEDIRYADRDSSYKTDEYYKNITPASRKDALHLNMLDERNIARYRREIDGVFDGSLPTGSDVIIGMPSDVLKEYGEVSDRVIRMSQRIARKIAYPLGYKIGNTIINSPTELRVQGDMEGKHNLGISAVKNLPLQIADPIAITRNNEKNSKKNSVVIWTNWITEDGKGVMLGLVIDSKGATGLQNNVSTVFQADEEYAKRFFENKEDILYTKNNKDINQLLSVRRYMPKARVDDTFIKSLAEKYPDVKPFQDRDARPYGILEEEYRLAEENKALKEDIKGLKYILKIEREKNFISTLDESRIKSASKYLLEKVDSKYNRRDFEDGMREIYLYIGESENVDGDAVMSKCVDLARRVMDKSNGFESKTKYFDRLIADIQKASANIDGDIESAWNSLAEKYPKVFSKDVNPSDMATELLNTMNATKETAEMYKGFNKDQARMSLATEIYNQYWYVSNMDAKNKEIQKLRLEHRKTMEFLRDKNKERLDKQRLADTMYYGRIINKVKKEKDAKYKHMREVSDRNEKMRKVKIDITKKAMTLNRWLKVNSKKEHINEELKPIVMGFLNTLDFSSKTNIDTGGQVETQADMKFAKALRQVQKMMEESTKAITGEGKYYGIQFAEGDIQNMRTLADIVNDRLANGQKYVLNQLSLEELNVLHEMVSKLKKGVEMANEFHTIEAKKGISDHAQTMIQDAEKLGQIEIHKGIRGWFDSMLNFKNKVPHYFFKMLGENGQKVFKAFQDGWDTFARNVHQVIQFTNNLYKAKEVKEWRKEIHTIEHRGKKIKMTVPQLMALYCLSKREQALKHITQGGVHISNIEDGKNVIAQNFTVHFTEAELKHIFQNELSERQIYVAEKLQEFMNTVCTEWGNEVTMKLYGIEQFGLEKFYFPIKSDPENINTDETQTANENPLFRLLNMSFSKPLNEDASNRIMVLDIFEVFAAHTSDMAKYNALALPVIDTYKLLNYKEKVEGKNGEYDTISLKRSMNTAYGKEAIGYIYEFLKDLNGTENTSRDSTGGKFFSYAKIAAVAANIRVALLQPTAYVKARLVMKDKYLWRALAHKPSTIKKNYERAMEYCGMVLWKSMGFYDTNISRGVLSQITHDESLRDKIVEFSMKGAEKGDQITLAYLWTACEHEIRAERKDLKANTPEFYQAIGLRLRDIIYATQVVDSTVTRSSLMRSGNMYDKMLTAFGSEPTLSLNMVQDAFLQYKLTERAEGKEVAIKKHKKNVLRATSTYALTSIVVSFIATAMDMYRDNDDDDEDEGKFMKAYIGNLTSELGVLGKIPYIKEFISYLNGFSSTRTDTQWMEQFSNTVNGIAKLISGKGNLYTVTKNLLRTLSSISGLPIYNVYRDVIAGMDKLGILEEEDLEEMLKDMQ